MRCKHCGRPLKDQISIDRGYGPTCFSKRPNKASDSYIGEEIDGMQVLSSKCILALNCLCVECEHYIDGDRAQGQLFSVA